MTTEELNKVDELRKELDKIDKRMDFYRYIKPKIQINNEGLNDYELCTVHEYLEQGFERAIEELKSRFKMAKEMKLKALASYIEGCENK